MYDYSVEIRQISFSEIMLFLKKLYWCDKRMTSKLILGSANFGTNYGIKNRYKKLNDTSVNNLIDFAASSKIMKIDTAQGYGDSEWLLGQYISDDFNVISKVIIPDRHEKKRKTLEEMVLTSIHTLNLSKLYGILIHNPKNLLMDTDNTTFKDLYRIRELGLVEKIGISIYNPNLLDEFGDVFDFDIIQVPFNILDQTFLNSGWAQRLSDNGVEIHIRSVFLQGVLLMSEEELPAYFSNNWPKTFKEWYGKINEIGKSADHIALGHCLQQNWVSGIVVGVDNVRQLERLVEIEKNSDHDVINDLSVDDELLINPSFWNF